jgi:hypothetical protein
MTRLQSAFVIAASLIGIAVASTLPASAQQKLNPASVPPSNYGYANYDTRILTVNPSLWCHAPICDRSRFTDKLENSPNLPVSNPQHRQVQKNKHGHIG